MRSSLLALASVIICLSGCVPDYGPKVQISAGSREDLIQAINKSGLRGMPSVKSVNDWGNIYGPGLKITTTHYEIFTTLLDPAMLGRGPVFMESVYRAYNSQLPQQARPQTGLRIYLFANRPQWEQFTEDFAGDQAETFLRIKAGGYYHKGACVAYDIGPVRTLSLLAHEGWHQFTDGHFKYRLPSWLDEGVATLFEIDIDEPGSFRLTPEENAYRLKALGKTLANDSLISLRDLITSNPGDVLASDQTEAVMAFYSQSYALVRFLREADSGRRLADYHRLLADGLRGHWPLDSASRTIAQDRTIQRNTLWNHVVGLVLFEEYVGDDYDQIEAEYLAFCRKIAGPETLTSNAGI